MEVCRRFWKSFWRSSPKFPNARLPPPLLLRKSSTAAELHEKNFESRFWKIRKIFDSIGFQKKKKGRNYRWNSEKKKKRVLWYTSARGLRESLKNCSPIPTSGGGGGFSTGDLVSHVIMWPSLGPYFGIFFFGCCIPNCIQCCPVSAYKLVIFLSG